MDLPPVSKILVISFYLLISIQGEKYTRIANCDCVDNKEYVNITKCNLKAISREKVLANFEFFLEKEIVNASIHFQAFQKSSSGVFYPFLFNYWANICDAIHGSPKVSFVVKHTIRLLQKYSKNSVKCHLKVTFKWYSVNKHIQENFPSSQIYIHLEIWKFNMRFWGFFWKMDVIRSVSATLRAKKIC